MLGIKEGCEVGSCEGKEEGGDDGCEDGYDEGCEDVVVEVLAWTRATFALGDNVESSFDDNLNDIEADKGAEVPSANGRVEGTILGWVDSAD